MATFKVGQRVKVVQLDPTPVGCADSRILAGMEGVVTGVGAFYNIVHGVAPYQVALDAMPGHSMVFRGHNLAPLTKPGEDAGFQVFMKRVLGPIKAPAERIEEIAA